MSQALESMIREAERQTKRKLKVIRTNNEEEYVAIDVFLNNEEIIHERLSTHSHESNKLSKRLNRTLRIMIRDMLISSGLSSSM
jgi:hypothetical protein